MMKAGGLIALVGVLLVGCASTQTAVGPPTVDVTGKWVGDWSGTLGSGPLTMALQQKEGSVTGDLVMGGGSPFSGSVSGTVSGNALSIAYRGGGAEFTVKQNEMNGFSRYGSRWILKRQE